MAQTHHSLSHPEALRLHEGGNARQGGSQAWYPRKWQQQAGCGPTNCATLLWYLAATRPGCEALAPGRDGTKESFVALMEAVWPYVTPGPMGVNRTAVFCRGAVRYGRDRGIPLLCDAVQLRRPGDRETAHAVAFLQNAFAHDRPVAFLNLAKSEAPHFEFWHWTTLVGYDPATMEAQMLDGGQEHRVDFGRWLGERKGKGGLVTIEKAEA